MTTELDISIRASMMFRVLFGTQDDRYEPDSAAALVEGLRGVSDEEGALTITLWALAAAGEAGWN